MARFEEEVTAEELTSSQMTSESEWLQSDDARPLVLYLESTSFFTRRKQLLFVAGCCRQDW